MKPPVVFLSIVCAALAAALFLGHNQTRKALGSAAKRIESLSNEVSQVSTRLALAHATAVQMQTNLQSVLDQRTAELSRASNVVVQLRAMLSSAQGDAAKTREQSQVRAERIGALEAQRDELTRRLESLSRTEKELAELRESLSFATGDRDMLIKESQRLTVENAALERKLTDLQFLRLQIGRVEADMQVAKRLASRKPGSERDLRRPVVMLPDGAVDFAPPASVETGN